MDFLNLNLELILYSLRNDVTGLLRAALTDWNPIVNHATRKAAIPAKRYTAIPTSVLYV